MIREIAIVLTLWALVCSATFVASEFIIEETSIAYR